MSTVAISPTVEVACYDTARVGHCFARDCSFEASLLIEARSDGASGTVFACSRHRPEGMLRALARYLDAASWADTANRSPAL